MKCQRIHEFVYDASGRCYSPRACEDFGYCRERNHAGLPDDSTRKAWQAQDAEPKEPHHG